MCGGPKDPNPRAVSIWTRNDPLDDSDGAGLPLEDSPDLGGRWLARLIALVRPA